MRKVNNNLRNCVCNMKTFFSADSSDIGKLG